MRAFRPQLSRAPVAIAIGGIVAAGGVALATGASVAGAVIGAALSVGFAAIGALLRPRPRTRSFVTPENDQLIVASDTQAVIGIGYFKTQGTLVDIVADGQYIYEVRALCAHPISGVDAIKVNGHTAKVGGGVAGMLARNSSTLTLGNLSRSDISDDLYGRMNSFEKTDFFASHRQAKRRDGATTLANADLRVALHSSSDGSFFGGVDSNLLPVYWRDASYRGVGISAVAIRYRARVARSPRVEFFLRGEGLASDGSFTANAAAWARWFVERFTAFEVDEARLTQSVVSCDSAGFAAGGVYRLTESPDVILRDFEDAIVGHISEIEGKAAIDTGRVPVPTATIGETDHIDLPRITPLAELQEEMSVLEATYTDACRYGTDEDYTTRSVQARSEVAVDRLGEKIARQTYPLIASENHALRRAYLSLAYAQHALSVECEVKPEFIRLRPNDFVRYSFPRHGITDATFRVVRIAFSERGFPTLTLIEENPSLWTLSLDELRETLDGAIVSQISTSLPTPTIRLFTVDLLRFENVAADFGYDFPRYAVIRVWRMDNPSRSYRSRVQFPDSADANSQPFTFSPPSLRFDPARSIWLFRFDSRAALGLNQRFGFESFVDLAYEIHVESARARGAADQGTFRVPIDSS